MQTQLKFNSLTAKLLKRSQVLTRLSVFGLLSTVLFGCLGSFSGFPVNYVIPLNNTDYELNDISAKPEFDVEVNFPNGVPGGVVVELNGVDITSELNCGAYDCTLDMAIGSGGGEANIIYAALRDGRNSLQVTEPQMKDVVFFTVDLPGAEVHILTVDDGWTGETFRIDREPCGSPAKNSAKAPVCMQTINGVDIARRTFTGKRGNLIATGYIDGEDYSDVTQMCVTTYTLSATGVQTSLASLGNGYAICDGADTTPTYEGSYYLDFGAPATTSLGGFENPGFTNGGGSGAPPSGGFQYAPTDPEGIWTYTGAAIITANGTAWGHPDAPEGNQVLAMQNNSGAAYRTITIEEAGTYNLDFQMAMRGAQNQTLQIQIDGGVKGSFTPASSAWESATANLGVLAAGSYELRIVGTASGGDDTAFVDDLQLWMVGGDTTYDFSFNVRDTGDNDSNYNENEVDVIEISVTDATGTYSTQWLRSNVPLWDSRMNNQGGLSLSFDHIAMLSTGIGVTDLVHGAVISAPGDSSDDIDLDIGVGTATITELYVGNDSRIDLSVPNQNSSTQGTIRVDADLEMRIYINMPGVCFGDISTGTRNSFFPYDADITLNIDQSTDPYIANVGISGGIDISSIGGGLCGGLAGAFSGLINDTLNSIIGNVVGGIVAGDIPTLRTKVFIEVADVGISRDFGPFYMPLQPEISDFYGVPKGGTGGGVNNIKWGVLMGLHPRGTNAVLNPEPGERNVSLGIKWNGVPAPASAALLAEDYADEGTPAISTTLGATLTEDFFNAILMGLWESGLVYFDWAFSLPDGSEAVLDNLRFTFATRQPWEINLYPEGTPDGDAQLYFPDLVIEILGDAVLPTPKSDYNIATMVADIYFNVNLNASDDGSSFRIEVADSLQIDIKEVSSDWDNTSEAQLIYILDQVFGYLSSGLAIDIPFPEILSSTVDIKSVRSDEFAIYLPIDVYNSQVYPNGPDGGLFSYSYSNIRGGNGDTGWRNLTNGVDDHYFGPEGWGFYPHHLTGNNRSSERRCNDPAGYVEFGCQGYTAYYWTEYPFEWGFRHTFNGDYMLSAISVDKRNDSAASRGNNVTLKLYRDGILVQTLGPTSGGSGAQTLSLGTSKLIDRVDFVVVPTGVANCSGEAQGCWTSLGDGLGKSGYGDNIINITEIDYIFEPYTP